VNTVNTATGILTGTPVHYTPHLQSALTALRLTLHVLAATIWVGGQFVVAGLLPTVRSLGEGAPRKIARAFARLSWPAYFVLIATGIWNVAAIHATSANATYKTALVVEIVLALAAGASALGHSLARSKALIGALGGLAGLFSLAALVVGIVLAG
jgi:putative copper export protein